MESINFNKKFILMVLLMAFLFNIFFIISVNAVNYDEEYRMALEDIEIYDENGNEIGIKINKGEYLNVRATKFNVIINGIEYVNTLHQSNSGFIKKSAVYFDEEKQVYITNKSINIYDFGENVIGKIDKGVMVDICEFNENGYFEIEIDGLIREDKLQPDTGQVGDLGQEGGEDPVRVDEGGNVITVITKGLLKLLFETLPKMLVNLFNNINL